MARCPTCGQVIALQSQGGHARAAKLTEAERSAIAKAGAAARWKGHKPSEKQVRPRKKR
jgi:hypothetical protein